MEKLSIGLAGAGSRGYGLLNDLLIYMNNIHIAAICDDYEDRAEKACAFVNEKLNYMPAAEKNYGDMLNRQDVDAVLIVTPWETHIPFAIMAMELGKPSAIEVGGASSLQECWDLVNTWERTKTPFMFLENCCFGKTELMVTNMVRQGLFGDIVHCEGAYAHDLRDEISGGDKNHHYRLRHYTHRNCENYPSHELGPIAKLMNVNNGNRMLTISSTASKSLGLTEYTGGGKFNQGDIITSVIRLAGGETIRLTLDTTLPRYYCRDFTVRGTKAMYEERTNSFFIDGVHEEHFNWVPEWNNAKQYEKKYEHELWTRFIKEGVTGGHGGMDGLVYNAFVECVLNNWEMPINVYDAASWMAVSPLSEESVSLMGQPVAIPDFTSGAWLNYADTMNDYTIRSRR